MKKKTELYLPSPKLSLAFRTNMPCIIKYVR